jgi:hypothetical protein
MGLLRGEEAVSAPKWKRRTTKYGVDLIPEHVLKTEHLEIVIYRDADLSWRVDCDAIDVDGVLLHFMNGKPLRRLEDAKRLAVDFVAGRILWHLRRLKLDLRELRAIISVDGFAARAIRNLDYTKR